MLDNPQVRKLVRLAVEEDLGLGDITSDLTIPPDAEASAVFLAREKFVICGLDMIGIVFDELGWRITTVSQQKDGEIAQDNTILAKIQGKTRHLISAERTVLNFLQRLSGVATFTRNFVESCPGLAVLDTRKTTPGWRVLEKYAVRVGGGKNHRYSLGDMILIKNNHIDANMGDIRGVMKKVLATKPFYMPVEVEVRDFVELEAALEFDPDIIMLDNMNNDEIGRAIEMVKKAKSRARIEVSGGINRERLQSLRDTGVSHVSAGALTTRAVNVDISMRIVG